MRLTIFIAGVLIIFIIYDLIHGEIRSSLVLFCALFISLENIYWRSKVSKLKETKENILKELEEIRKHVN